MSIPQQAQTQGAFRGGRGSARVFHNVSTRFADSGEFGISTDKLHARCPMGPRELTSYRRNSA